MKLPRFSILSLLGVCATAACFFAPFAARREHVRFFVTESVSRESGPTNWDVISYKLRKLPQFKRIIPKPGPLSDTDLGWTVTEARLEGAITDRMAYHLGRCHRLDSVRIIAGGNCDLLCKNLAKSRRLRLLTLTDCELTEAGLTGLSRCTRLELLVLNKMQTTASERHRLISAMPQTYCLFPNRQ